MKSRLTTLPSKLCRQNAARGSVAEAQSAAARRRRSQRGRRSLVSAYERYLAHKRAGERFTHHAQYRYEAARNPLFKSAVLEHLFAKRFPHMPHWAERPMNWNIDSPTKADRNRSSYYYICVRILLFMCPHTAICVLILLYVSDYHVSSYCCICVLILLYVQQGILVCRRRWKSCSIACPGRLAVSVFLSCLLERFS